jgi:hypothetical protein
MGLCAAWTVLDSRAAARLLAVSAAPVALVDDVRVYAFE